MQVIDAVEARIEEARAREHPHNPHRYRESGARLRSWTTLTDDRLDLDAGTMFVPAELTKEGRDKLIPLSPDEVHAMRRQLVARAPGTRLVAPKAQGGQFVNRAHFYRLVWNPALRRAAEAWRQENGYGDDVPTPYDGYQFKWLRRTAVALYAAGRARARADRASGSATAAPASSY